MSNLVKHVKHCPLVFELFAESRKCLQVVFVWKVNFGEYCKFKHFMMRSEAHYCHGSVYKLNATPLFYLSDTSLSALDNNSNVLSNVLSIVFNHIINNEVCTFSSTISKSRCCYGVACLGGISKSCCFRAWKRLE